MMAKRIRTAGVSIDIGEQTINIIKTRRDGKIAKTGAAAMPGFVSSEPSDEYGSALASAINAAAKAAGIGGGECVIVVGGMHILVHTFVWPEMPPASLQSNAESEIAPFLPADVERFSVSYKVLRRKELTTAESGHPVRQLEVVVAAMAKDLAETLLTAARRAGFNPKRIDIRENARSKLLHDPDLWTAGKAQAQDAGFSDFNPEQSYAVLDISNMPINITVFINGAFYANRYFGSLVRTPAVVSAPVYAAGEEDFPDAAPTEEIAGVDADNLADEIVSIIDYMHYRERSCTIGSILLFGSEDKVPHLLQSLSGSLEIPIHQPAAILRELLSCRKHEQLDFSNYLDAYGAALLPEKTSVDLNLKPKKIRRRIFKRFVMPIACAALILGALFGGGVYYSVSNINGLKSEEKQLNEELARYTVTEADVAQLNEEIDEITRMADDIDTFNRAYPPASEVLDNIYAVMPAGTQIYSIAILDGNVSVTGSTNSMDKVAQIARQLRQNTMFASANVPSTSAYSDSNDVEVVDFEVRLVLASDEEDAK